MLSKDGRQQQQPHSALRLTIIIGMQGVLIGEHYTLPFHCNSISVQYYNGLNVLFVFQNNLINVNNMSFIIFFQAHSVES